MLASRPPVTVWCFTDGKAGHENQVQGLLAALRKHLPIEDHTIPASADHHPLWSLLTGRDAVGKGLPAPSRIEKPLYSHWSGRSIDRLTILNPRAR